MKKIILAGAMYLTSLCTLAQEIPEYNKERYERKARRIELRSRLTGKQNKEPYMLFLEDNNFRLNIGSISNSLEDVNSLFRETNGGFDYIKRIRNTDYFVLASSQIQSNARMQALSLAKKFEGYTNDELKKIDVDKRNKILTPNEVQNYLKNK